MERLPIKEFSQFQAEIMGDRKAIKKCTICAHGLTYGPAKADENCHKCGIERRENQG